MSRLYEALSNVETRRGLPKVALRTVASPDAVPPDAIAVSVNPPEPAQELQTEQRLPVEIPEAELLSEMVPQDEIGLAEFPPVPAEEVETESWSSQGHHLKLVSPDVIPPDATAVDLSPSKPTQIAKLLAEVPPKQVEILDARSVQVRVSPESRLVALTDPSSLGAEQFRALV